LRAYTTLRERLNQRRTRHSGARSSRTRRCGERLGSEREVGVSNFEEGSWKGGGFEKKKTTCTDNSCDVLSTTTTNEKKRKSLRKGKLPKEKPTDSAPHPQPAHHQSGGSRNKAKRNSAAVNPRQYIKKKKTKCSQARRGVSWNEERERKASCG